MTFIIELTSLIKSSSQTVILMNIIYIALKTSFKKQHFFELTSLLKMDLTFIIKFAQKFTSLIKMDLTSLFKMSFKKQPSDNFHVPDSELFSCDQVPDWMVLNPLRWAKRQIIIARDQRDLNVPQDETIRG